MFLRYQLYNGIMELDGSLLVVLKAPKIHLTTPQNHREQIREHREHVRSAEQTQDKKHTSRRRVRGKTQTLIVHKSK